MWGSAAGTIERCTVPSSAALDSTLQQAAGLAPSQVTVENVCSSAPKGAARCAAKSLHLRSSGKLVHTSPNGGLTLGRIRPSGAVLFPGINPATTPAQSIPTATTPAYLQQSYDLTYLSQTNPVGAANAGSYTIQSGDTGAILRVRETADNSGGVTVIWSARL